MPSLSRLSSAALLLLLSASAHAALVVTSFGDHGTALPLQIGTDTITLEFDAQDTTYYKFGLEAANGGFGRFFNLSGACVYYFRTEDAEELQGVSLTLENIYSITYGVAGPSKQNSSLVDGALWGDDNYLPYFDAADNLVAVLRVGFTEGTEDIRILGLAYDPDGLTLSNGIAAASPVPEPSAALLLTLAAGTASFARRRR